MSQLQEHVEQSVRSRRLFRRGQRILVAVSGGVDSMVLLRVLRELAPRNAWRLTVAHFNHQLRGRSSTADERLVCQTARKLRLPVVVERGAVRQFARAHKLSLEMAARSLRHNFLARTAARLRIPTVAIAHHADDQLELFFLRLLRGSSGEGLAGMPWRSASPSDPAIELTRPLLDLPKSALSVFAIETRIAFREDATNALLDFQRNRIRHELLPLLRNKYQPALEATTLRLMDIVGAEAELVTHSAIDWLRHRCLSLSLGAANVKRLTSVRGSGISRPRLTALRTCPFKRLPVAIQRRCLQLQLLSLGVEVDFDLVERLRLNPNTSISVKTSGPGVPLASSCVSPAKPLADWPATGRHPQRIARTPVPLLAVRGVAGVVRLERARTREFNTNALEVSLDVGGGEVVFGGARIAWQADTLALTRRPNPRPGRELFDADRVGGRILLRHWQPGDRFHPIGMKCAVKLQDFFTNQKVPGARRRELIVASTVENEIFWVEGMRISERFKLTKHTIRRLQWRWQRL